jgi:hypothetical protein
MKASLLLALAATLVCSCSDTSSGVPGTVNLTVKASANCIGIADTVDVTLTNSHFGTVVPGGDAFTKAIAPMQYTITAASRNGAKQWSETKNILSSYTFECGCQ